MARQKGKSGRLRRLAIRKDVMGPRPHTVIFAPWYGTIFHRRSIVWIGNELDCIRYVPNDRGNGKVFVRYVRRTAAVRLARALQAFGRRFSHPPTADRPHVDGQRVEYARQH